MAKEPTVQKNLPSLERGRDLSRIVAFTDGVFAIAITLLVLQIDVPSGADSASALGDALLDQSPDFTAFAISFAVIGHFWVSNHRFMRTVREFDRGLMFQLLLYLGFMVLIPFSSQLMGEYSDQFHFTVIIYTANMIGIVFAAWLMVNHVLARGLAEPQYVWDLELTRKSQVFSGAVFLLSIPFAFVLGSWTPLLWFTLRWDPYQRRRNAAYRQPNRPLPAEGDGGEAVDDPAPRQ
jgi:uncharacterized membrane protein